MPADQSRRNKGGSDQILSITVGRLEDNKGLEWQGENWSDDW